MTCNCGKCRCPLYVKTSSIEVDSEFLMLNVPALEKDLYNRGRIYICVAQSIPEEATSLLKVQLVFEDGSGKFTLQNNCGNFVYADQIRCRKVYHTVLATDSELLTVPCYELCNTRHVFPVIEPAVPPAAPPKQKKLKKDE